MNVNGIDRLSATMPAAPGAELPLDARGLAGFAIGEIGQRLQAWSALASGAPGGSGFTPDQAKLARGGDVYDLRQLSDEIGRQLGATPSDQGALLRGIEDFTREAAVQVYGLAGSDRQAIGLDAAVAAALDQPAGEGADGVVTRLQAATDLLAAQNSG